MSVADVALAASVRAECDSNWVNVVNRANSELLMEPHLTRATYPRFVCPPDGTIQDDGGFLFDPESEYSPRLQPQVEPLVAVGRFPCLVLLGEPGSGKSTALRTLTDAGEVGTVFRCDLAAWASPRIVDAELTEGRVVPAFVLDRGEVPQRRVHPCSARNAVPGREHPSAR